MINPDALIVGKELALLDEVRVSRLRGIGHIPLNPNVWIADGIRLNKCAVVIILVHRPGKLELAQIGKAGGPLSFDFCLGQNWEEKRRQNSNGSDNDQQFEERKASTPDKVRRIHNSLMPIFCADLLRPR